MYLVDRKKDVIISGGENLYPVQIEDFIRTHNAVHAREGCAMTCGGASGVDTAAQRGFLRRGGGLILVPALPVAELMQQAYLCEAMEKGRLLLVCDTWPQERLPQP